MIDMNNLRLNTFAIQELPLRHMYKTMYFETHSVSVLITGF